MPESSCFDEQGCEPQVRATAARALGSLLRGMGEAIGMQELLSWLLATLKSEVCLPCGQEPRIHCLPCTCAGAQQRRGMCAG